MTVCNIAKKCHTQHRRWHKFSLATTDDDFLGTLIIIRIIGVFLGGGGDGVGGGVSGH